MARVGMVQNTRCQCSYPVEDIDHILWDCTHTREHRKEMLQQLRTKGLIPSYQRVDASSGFRHVVEKILLLRNMNTTTRPAEYVVSILKIKCTWVLPNPGYYQQQFQSRLSLIQIFKKRAVIILSLSLQQKTLHQSRRILLQLFIYFRKHLFFKRTFYFISHPCK